MTTEPALPPLQTPSRPPAEMFDVALLDLDGVVYLGRDPVPGAAAGLSGAREAGMRLAFVTNNASRTPEEVVTLLDEVGVKADVDEVVTSAQAAGRMLAERLPVGSRVLVVGTDALRREVTARGLMPVSSAEERPSAVVCGYSPDISWRHLAEATVAVRGGAYWLATNADLTLPSSRGPLPGNGSLVGVISIATGQRPEVAGKPDPALHQESVDRTAARRPLVVGDLLATDIEGANRAGCASMLVLSGVTTPATLLTAAPLHRPTFLADDVGGLLLEHPAVQAEGAIRRCGRWRAALTADGVVLGTDGAAGDGDPLDALRALCVAVWAAADASAPTSVAADDADAATLLGEWGVA